MKLFLDTANLGEIRAIHAWGVLDGVTTNPTLVAREKVELHRRVVEICELVKGPVSAEVVETEADAMVRQGKELAMLHPQVVVKIPMTADGLQACSRLSDAGYAVNMTLVFSVNQALLAARAGATYVSPFVGRLDDVGHDGIGVVAEIVEVFRTHKLETQVLAASLRHPRHVADAARVGADVGTMPYSVMLKLLDHPLTDIGLQRFMDDWRRSGQT